MINIKRFIENYTKSDFPLIRFDWNGEHGDNFSDPNMDRRIRVCDYLIKDFSIASDNLIIDLYTELSKSSPETWGVYRNYHLFAQEIVNRGPTEYLHIYINGARQSFDTVIASGRISLSNSRKKEIISYLKSDSVTKTESLDESDIDFAIKRFEILP